MPEQDTTAEHTFWEFKKYREHEWYRFLIILLFSIVIIYVVTHLWAGIHSQYEYERLDKEELQHISRIYFDSITVQKDTVTASADSLARLKNAKINFSCCDSSKCARVLLYLDNQFNNKLDSEQLKKIRPYLCTAKPLEAISFLTNIRFRMKSYFWLVGPSVYFEIIFWAMFGVIASLLFTLGIVGRNATTDPKNSQSVFDSSEIPYQFAKLWYAPLCTLVIILGYNFFSEDNIVDISSSKGVIVFSFIGGFYSARLISFLDRLKEVLLPHSGSADLPVQTQSTGALLTNITIGLQLDEALPPELRNDITEMGLGTASVVLENKENAERVQAVRSSEDQSASFIVESINPGTYIIKATWAGEVGGQPVNLVAEQEEALKSSDSNINVTLKKDGSDG